jgi:hypothetical protein
MIYRKRFPKIVKNVTGLSEIRFKINDVEKRHEEVVKSYLNLHLYQLFNDIENKNAKYTRKQVLFILKQLKLKAILSLYPNLEIFEKLDELLEGLEKEQKKEEVRKIDVEKLQTEFINYKIKIDKVSNSSIKSYKSAFKYFNLFFKNKNITKITETEIFKFQEQLCYLPVNTHLKYKGLNIGKLMKIEGEKNLNNKTVNGFFTVYKMFFKYLKKQNVIEKNIMLDIENLKEFKSEKEPYSLTDLKKIFENLKDEEFWIFVKLGCIQV